MGLLSTLDAVAGAPMEEVIEELPLSPDLKEALLHGAGPLGEALRCVRSFEAGDWDRTEFHHLNCEFLTRAYADGVDYSQRIWGNLKDGGLAA